MTIFLPRIPGDGVLHVRVCNSRGVGRHPEARLTFGFNRDVPDRQGCEAQRHRHQHGGQAATGKTLQATQNEKSAKVRHKRSH